MYLTETKIKDLYIIEPKIYKDSRGYFFESFSLKYLQNKGLNYTFIQDNQSKSQYGVIRGLHFQKAPYAQTKLLRVLEGKIFDVALDMRKSSPDFGKSFGIEISAENNKQLLIPKGFAHGFSVLSETAVVMYKCDEYYSPESEGGIKFSDPNLKIDWGIEKGKEIVSEKDTHLPNFEDSDYYFD
ncbi:MAG: dTDP-4-dehydrorhamnose 3,5-epimerase [Bacteroidales bacterium]|nr:dTDP-4-dehydrorhamnose 3,5-epimerase [Bacteroidales bacterium]